MKFEVISKDSSPEEIHHEDLIDLAGKIKVDEDDGYVVLMTESTVSKQITIHEDYVNNFWRNQ